MKKFAASVMYSQTFRRKKKKFIRYEFQFPQEIDPLEPLVVPHSIMINCNELGRGGSRLENSFNAEYLRGFPLFESRNRSASIMPHVLRITVDDVLVCTRKILLFLALCARELFFVLIIIDPSVIMS